MARRCEHCKHWVDMVFKGQSASGWGVWYGNCHNTAVPMPPIGMDRHSLMLACERFEAGSHPHSLSAMTANGEVRGASRLAGEASSAEGATSTVVLGTDSKREK